MSDKTLTLKFTLKETGVVIEIAGKRSGLWVDVLKDAMPKVYDSLADQDGDTLESAKAKLIATTARMAGKSVEDIMAELKNMPGDENVNLARLSTQYMSEFEATEKDA